MLRHSLYRRHRHHHRGRAFGRGRFFGAGEVRLALLDLLAEEPRHGYDLIKALETRSGGAYRASAGSIYPTLQLLEDEGLAVADPREGKRVYRLTDAGRAQLAEEREAVDAIWRRAEDWSEWGPWGGLFDPEAAEVLRPALRLAKAAVRAAARDPALVDEIRALLRRVRSEIDDLSRAR